jgi:hypothetical protein
MKKEGLREIERERERDRQWGGRGREKYDTVGA